MIKEIMKMGGCKTEKEFYKKYPSEQAFLEAFPQARPMMEQFAMGGTPEAYPQQPTMDKFFNYGPATMNIPRLFQEGGMQQQDPTMQVIMMVAEQMQMDPNQLVQMLQQAPDVFSQLQQLVAQDPNQAAQALMQLIQGGGGQEQMAFAEESDESDMEAEAMSDEQAMMAYGGNPFIDSPLKRFTSGGLPKHQVPPGQTGKYVAPRPGEKNCWKN